MKRHLLLHILLLGLTSLLLGCSTTASFGPKNAVFQQQSPWALRLNPGPGAIDVDTTLKPGERIRFKLSHSDDSSQIAYLELLDTDCDIGHKGHLVYLTERNGFQSQYLDQEVPWGEPIDMTLRWDPQNNLLEARINGQRQRVELVETPSRLKVSTPTDEATQLEVLYFLPETSASQAGESP
ncbi:hypothetical protein [Marinimicrobium sp. C2-29]|uniref:hypothetical protein n=1 Tax=Marinimicrobium sp. C2-29 TaxID=3139825 RepID=UPI0031392204